MTNLKYINISQRLITKTNALIISSNNFENL